MLMIAFDKHVEGVSSTVMFLVSPHKEQSSPLRPALSLSFSQRRHEYSSGLIGSCGEHRHQPAASSRQQAALPLQESSLSFSCGASSLTLGFFLCPFPVSSMHRPLHTCVDTLLMPKHVKNVWPFVQKSRLVKAKHKAGSHLWTWALKCPIQS